MPRLVVIKGADEGKTFALSEPQVTIGRDTNSRIRLHDTEVSRRHAELRMGDGAYSIVDLGSANGTFVNSQRTQNVQLKAGDRITLGQTILVFSTGLVGRIEPSTDLAKQISLISRGELDESAIVKTIGEGEGGRILSQPDKSSPWVQSALANLTIMYEASKAVSHILDLGELLTRIIELVFRTINADRGCFMVKNADSTELEPRAILWRKENTKQEKFAISRTIMDYV